MAVSGTTKPCTFETCSDGMSMPSASSDGSASIIARARALGFASSPARIGRIRTKTRTRSFSEAASRRVASTGDAARGDELAQLLMAMRGVGVTQAALQVRSVSEVPDELRSKIIHLFETFFL